MSYRSRSDEDYPEVPVRMVETPWGPLLVPGDETDVALIVDPRPANAVPPTNSAPPPLARTKAVTANRAAPLLARTKTDPYPPGALEKLLANCR